MIEASETNQGVMSPGIRMGQLPPFHEIGEYPFQELCRAIFGEEPGIEACYPYGSRGYPQFGIDLLAHRTNGDGVEVGQCKCYKKFTCSDIEKATKEFFDNWDHWKEKKVKRFILFVACGLNDPNCIEQIGKEKTTFKEFSIHYELWSSPIIQTKLRPQPAIVRSHLYPPDHWVKVICGDISQYPSMSTLTQNPVYESEDYTLGVQLRRLSDLASGQIGDTIENLRRSLREGRREEALLGLEKIKKDNSIWPVLLPDIQAAVISFEAELVLIIEEDINKAKNLVHEAQELDPSNDQTRLRALIALVEDGPEEAIKLLDGQEDIDCKNLKARLLLNMGNIEECQNTLKIR